tara:strand:+ start:1171 stop:2334 length:1164 start_codon:yes stop_codon:yes gene_type:complete
MSKINIRDFYNENEDGAPDIVGVSTFSSTAYFVPTKGTTAQRPSDHVEVGSIRFNTDTSNLEYYRGHTLGWSQFELIDPELGGGTGSNTGLGTRGLSGGSGDPATGRQDILFLTVSTLGDTQIFGDLTSAKYATAGLGSRTRGLFAGGYNPTQLNTIDFVTFASTGNATDFGDTIHVGRDRGALSTDVRGLIFGGIAVGPAPTGTNEIVYVTMAQEGNAVDFGDVGYSGEGMEGISSSTRGLICGGSNPSTKFNSIEFVTITTTGNATDFGDMQAQRWTFATGSNSTRGIIGGGRTPDADSGINTIDFVTIATTGNAQNFGDLTQARSACDGISDPTRFVIAGGYVPSSVNTIDFVTISTTGDATDFGDLTYSRNRAGSCSNGHGGL